MASPFRVFILAILKYAKWNSRFLEKSISLKRQKTPGCMMQPGVKDFSEPTQ